MTPFLRDTLFHFCIEEVATAGALLGGLVWRHRACAHRWNRWVRRAVAVGGVMGFDFIVAAICVRVVG
jgi:hypothetical protein